MIFKWLKRILRLKTSSLSDKTLTDAPEISESKLLCDELDNRKRIVKQDKEKLVESSIDWYKLDLPSKKKKLRIYTFVPRKLENVLSFQFLKKKRLIEEARELKEREERVNLLLDQFADFIAQQKVQEAKQIMGVIVQLIRTISDVVIKDRYVVLQKSLYKLEGDLEHERLVRLVEEQRQKEEEERKRKEIEEHKRIENEIKLAEKREQIRQRINWFIKKAQEKEQAEIAEKERLEILSTERKENWYDFKRILDSVVY